jgi:hypothetical protein
VPGFTSGSSRHPRHRPGAPCRTFPLAQRHAGGGSPDGVDVAPPRSANRPGLSVVAGLRRRVEYSTPSQAPPSAATGRRGRARLDLLLGASRFSGKKRASVQRTACGWMRTFAGWGEMPVARYGIAQRPSSVCATGLGVLDVAMHLAEVRDVIAATSKSAFEEDDADSVCLVCAAVGPFAPELTSAFHSPGSFGRGGTLHRLAARQT